MCDAPDTSMTRCQELSPSKLRLGEIFRGDFVSPGNSAGGVFFCCQYIFIISKPFLPLPSFSKPFHVALLGLRVNMLNTEEIFLVGADFQRNTS